MSIDRIVMAFARQCNFIITGSYVFRPSEFPGG